MNGVFLPLLSSLSKDARARGWCWRIKKGVAELNPTTPEKGTKKGKRNL
jgi:hypothetical protein